MENKVKLRPETSEDMPMLYRTFFSTRTEEFAPLQWSEEQLHAFLKSQFDLQHKYYYEEFPKTSFGVILNDGVPAGRLYINRREDMIHIVDIALLPEHRRQGIGTWLLNRLIAEGNEAGLPVRIEVERYNPAMTLYQRLGFIQTEDHEIYYVMVHPPVPKDANEVSTAAA